MRIPETAWEWFWGLLSVVFVGAAILSFAIGKELTLGLHFIVLVLLCTDRFDSHYERKEHGE